MAIRVLILAACLTSTAAAQTTKPSDPYQQAYQRMLQRQAARAAAATQPAKISQSELDELRSKLASLEREVVELKAENSKLRALMQVASSRPADKSLLSKIHRGMTYQQARDAIGFEPSQTSVNADGVKTCIWRRVEVMEITGTAPNYETLRGMQDLQARQRANPKEILTVEFEKDKVADFQDDARP